MTVPVKVGIVGIGRAGGGMISREAASKPGKFQIYAYCDPEDSQISKYTEKYKPVKIYNDDKSLFKDKDVELIVISSPSLFHVKQALEAIKTGKYVLLEKPIALTYKDAQKLKKAVEKSNGKLLFRHNRRFEPAFQHIREIIASGIIGEVYEIKLRRNSYSRRNDWQTLTECGGGQLNNWGPHIIDHALRFLECPVKEIWSDLKLVSALGDAEDHLKIILKGENNRIVDLEISGGAAIKEPEYIVFGKKGGLTCDDKTISLKYLDPKVKLADIKVSRGLPDGFNNETLPWVEENIPIAPASKCDVSSIWDHIYETIRNGKEFPIKTEEALEVVRITNEVKKRSKIEAVK